MQRVRVLAFVLSALLCLDAGAAEERVRLMQVMPWLKEVDVPVDPARRVMQAPGFALAQMAEAEYEPICLRVENGTDKALTYQVDTRALRKAVPGLEVKVRSSWVTHIRHAGLKGNALKTLKVEPRFGDPRDVGEPLLEVTPGRRLWCPPGEVRTFWLILHTDGTPPGLYRAPVRIHRPDQPDEVVAGAELRVQVWPFRLPEKLEIACYHWDYGCHPKALADMREHKVNTFMIAALPHGLKVMQDGSVSGDMGLDRIRMKREVVPWAQFVGSYGCFAQFIEWCENPQYEDPTGKPKTIKYMSPEFKELFARTVRFMVAELKKAGLDYDDYMIQHIDEAHDGLAKRVVEMGKLARRIDPKLRWAQTVMAPLEQVKTMAPYSDGIMYRGEAYWSPEAAKWYRERQTAGTVLWQFKQLGLARGTPQVHMWNRLRQWRTWLNGWSGSATFVYSACVYLPYEDPIPVRHWEAVRESNEDYQYFAIVRELATKVAKQDPKRAKQGLKLVDDLVQTLTGPTAPGTGMLYSPEHMACMLHPYRARARIAREIAELKRLLGEDAPKIEEDQDYLWPCTAAVEMNFNEAGALTDGIVSLSSPSSYKPDKWDSAPVRLTRGVRYAISADVRAEGLIQDAVQVIVPPAPGSKKKRPKAIFSTSLPEMRGRWTQLLAVPRSGRYRVRLLCAVQQAPGPEGKPRAASLHVEGLRIVPFDRQPLEHLAARVRRQFDANRKLAGGFRQEDDPVLKTLRTIEPRLLKTLSDMEQAEVSPEELMERLEDIEAELSRRPYATWRAASHKLPLPARPPSSETAFGAATGQVRPGMGLEADGPEGRTMGPAAVGIANFRGEPLCFMVKSKARWFLCDDLGRKDKRTPTLHRPEQFLKRYGWAELVVPAGSVRYLWITESGTVDLFSMDGRVPDTRFEVRIEAM